MPYSWKIPDKPPAQPEPLQEWECNIYWARAQMHEHGGPVPHYVTLTGDGRKVEIGAFLSEVERVALYGELLTALRH